MRSLALVVGLVPAAVALGLMVAAVPFGLAWIFCVWSAARLGVPGFSFEGTR